MKGEILLVRTTSFEFPIVSNFGTAFTSTGICAWTVVPPEGDSDNWTCALKGISNECKVHKFMTCIETSGSTHLVSFWPTLYALENNMLCQKHYLLISNAPLEALVIILASLSEGTSVLVEYFLDRRSWDQPTAALFA